MCFQGDNIPLVIAGYISRASDINTPANPLLGLMFLKGLNSSLYFYLDAGSIKLPFTIDLPKIQIGTSRIRATTMLLQLLLHLKR